MNPRVAEINASKKVLSRILKSKTYSEFCTRISGAGVLPPTPGQVPEFLGDLHSVGHGGIGGEVSSSNKHGFLYSRFLDDGPRQLG